MGKLPFTCGGNAESDFFPGRLVVQNCGVAAVLHHRASGGQIGGVALKIRLKAYCYTVPPTLSQTWTRKGHGGVASIVYTGLLLDSAYCYTAMYRPGHTLYSPIAILCPPAPP